MKMRRGKIWSWGIGLTASVAVFLPAAAQAAIVPCGRRGMPPCTMCDFIILGQSLVNYGLRIVAIVAITVITIAGVMYVVSAGNEATITAAKNAMKYAIGGTMVVLLAWILINTLIHRFLPTSNFQVSGSWASYQCGASNPTGEGGETNPIPQTEGEANPIPQTEGEANPIPQTEGETNPIPQTEGETNPILQTEGEANDSIQNSTIVTGWCYTFNNEIFGYSQRRCFDNEMACVSQRTPLAERADDYNRSLDIAEDGSTIEWATPPPRISFTPCERRDNLSQEDLLQPSSDPEAFRYCFIYSGIDTAGSSGGTTRVIPPTSVCRDTMQECETNLNTFKQNASGSGMTITSTCSPMPTE